MKRKDFMQICYVDEHGDKFVKQLYYTKTVNDTHFYENNSNETGEKFLAMIENNYNWYSFNFDIPKDYEVISVEYWRK